MTFRAKPWLVTHLAIRTPIAASFSSPTHTPVSPASARRNAEPGHRTDQHLFQIANVTVNVAAIRAEVDDRVADELTGTVIRDIPAASCLDYLHAFFFQCRGRRHDVRAIVARLYAERDDWGVFEQEQLIGNRVRLPLLDEALLQIDAFSVGNRSKPADFKRTRHSVLILELSPEP